MSCIQDAHIGFWGTRVDLDGETLTHSLNDSCSMDDLDGEIFCGVVENDARNDMISTVGNSKYGSPLFERRKNKSKNT